ncbi:MAG: hypothetical protein ACPKPY_01025 [Nitrososphaeraceae archaeon]
MKSKIPIGISIDKEILNIIDKNRGDIPRSTYIIKKLKGIKNKNSKNNVDLPDSSLRPEIKQI